MACATLKRPLDFDPLLHDHHKSPKRQRCAPMAVSPSSSSAVNAPSSSKPNSPFGEVKPAMTSVAITSKVHEELRRMQRRRQIKAYHRCNKHVSHENGQDCSSGSDSEPEMMTSSSLPMDRVSGLKDDPALDPVALPFPTSTKKDLDDKPIFTFKQVSLICERLVREREEAVREEYDKVLTTKLAEQYDAFVKFTYDQIQRRLNDRPMSYVS